MRGVGTEGAPVFGRLAHIGVSQHHGNVFALNVVDQNTVVFAGFFEGIVKRAGHFMKN
jgi:hypothetical protein